MSFYCALILYTQDIRKAQKIPSQLSFLYSRFTIKEGHFFSKLLLHFNKEVNIAIAFLWDAPHHFKSHIEIELLGSVIEVSH